MGASDEGPITLIAYRVAIVHNRICISDPRRIRIDLELCNCHLSLLVLLILAQPKPIWAVRGGWGGRPYSNGSPPPPRGLGWVGPPPPQWATAAAVGPGAVAVGPGACAGPGWHGLGEGEGGDPAESLNPKATQKCERTKT